MDTSPERMRAIWAQKSTPVLLRRDGPKDSIRARFPYMDQTKIWLRNGRRIRPLWNPDQKCWEFPKAWFNDTVERSLMQWGRAYIIQPYRAQEICAPACQNAKGHECQCSCMGAHHAQGQGGGWFVASDAFAARWGERQLASRLLTRKAAPPAR